MRRNNIHFIIGIWRSGTSLIREVLGMSDDIQILPEHYVLLNHLKFANAFNEKNKAKVYSNIIENPDFLYFANPDLKELAKNWKEAHTLGESISVAYEACVKKGKSPSIILDKNPIYSYYLEEIMQTFPDAKFVWMLREPKDNCISRAEHNIQSFKNYGYLASWWNHTNYLIAQQAAKFPQRFLLVHYDDMVKHPKRNIEGICDFLGTPFQEEMLRFEKKKEERIADFVMASKLKNGRLSEKYIHQKKRMWENLQQPINSSKTEQWKSKMHTNQVEAINRLCSDFYTQLVSGNYKAVPPSSVWNFFSEYEFAKVKVGNKNKQKKLNPE